MNICKKQRIQTARLELKPYSERDTGTLAALLMNPEIAKTFMVPEFESAAQAEALAEKLVGFSRIEDVRHLEYGIYLNGTLIGFVNDCGIEGDAIEIGYVVHPEYQGRGYASEAVKAVLSELHEMGFRKASAGYFAENEASHRVMEKCGMKPVDRTDEQEYRGEKHLCRYCEIEF